MLDQTCTKQPKMNSYPHFLSGTFLWEEQYMQILKQIKKTKKVLVWYWFSEDFLNQPNHFCSSIISSNNITREHYDDIIIKNGHCSHKITSVGWCKCHDKFRITASLYPYFIFKAIFVTGSHSFLYSLLLNVRALTPWILTISYFFAEHAIKQNQKPTVTSPLKIIATSDNHSLPPFSSLALVPSPPPSITPLSLTFLKRGVESIIPWRGG